MISDNNHIIYSAEDIQRYWNGQLSPEEMHAMEKAALDDPFLADAMDGIGMALQEHDNKVLNTQLGEIQEHIEVRAHGTVQIAPVRSFRWWQVAAAAFVLMVAGYWIFSSGRSDADGLVAKQTRANETRDVTATKPDSGARDLMRENGIPPAPGNLDTALNTTSGLIRTEEPGLREFRTTTPGKKKERFGFAITENKQQPRSKTLPVTLPEAKKEQSESAPFRGVAYGPTGDTARKMETEVVKVQDTFAAFYKADGRLAAKEPKLQNIISGLITDNRNNPLPNVFIRLDNNKDSYTTDPLGNFKIPVSDSVVNVSVSLQGYATQNFLLRSSHNGAGIAADNKIRMQTNDELAANQSVYFRKGSFDKKGKAQYDNELVLQKITDQDAQPVYGWLTFDKYLEQNKRLPASNPHLTGEVALSFEINKKGERSDYRIEQSLSADHDAEALRLVKEGPAWKLTKGRKSRVTVIVRF